MAETNQGGDLVQSTLRQVAPDLPYKGIHASKSKRTRAEPIAALWEQGRCHFVGGFPELEDQLVNYVPGLSPRSPDRLDALVHGMTELFSGCHYSLANGFQKADAAPSRWTFGG